MWIFRCNRRLPNEGRRNGNKILFKQWNRRDGAKTFWNRDLRVLFDAAQDASSEDLKTTYDMLMALKKKERGQMSFDYQVYLLDGMTVNEAVTENEDGSYTIFVNKNLCESKQIKAINHALNHIKNNDLKRAMCKILN